MNRDTDIPASPSDPTLMAPAREDDGLMWSPRVDLSPGTTLGDRYRIEDRIGVGGMATVFRAEHIDIGKPVAIKVLGEELARKPALVQRFMQEARAVSLIRHPHIVDITDFGHVREDLPYYAMEYLQGETLAARIRREGRLPWPVVRQVGMQLSAALAAAHKGGVVHRDMKPDNVFLVERDDGSIFVKVLDFGIAKILTDDGAQNLTRTGVIMGTAAYMSPEQAKSQDIDARTDLYAAGIMLYEMLAGRVPFEGEGVMDVLTKHIMEPVPPLRRIVPTLPPAVERVISRALHKDRSQRFASARELGDALGALGDEGGRESRWIRRLVGGAAIAAAVAGVIAWNWPAEEGVPSSPPASPLPVTPPSRPKTQATAPPKDGPTTPTPKEPAAIPRALPTLPTEPPPSAELPSVTTLPGLEDLEPEGTGGTTGPIETMGSGSGSGGQ